MTNSTQENLQVANTAFVLGNAPFVAAAAFSACTGPAACVAIPAILGLEYALGYAGATLIGAVHDAIYTPHVDTIEAA